MTLQDYINQVRSLVHDLASVDYTDAELTSYINNARTAVALDFQCVRRFVQGATIIAQKEQYDLASGAICGATIGSGGSGYTSAPTVTFSGGTPIEAAQGVAVVTNGVVTQINMTQWGRGYSALPSVGFSGGGGTGATAVALGMLNVLNVVSISNIWGNQRYMLKYAGFTRFQAYFRPQMQYFMRPGIFTIYQQTMLVFLQPVPDQTYVTEWDIITLPNPLVLVADVDTQVTMPWADAVQYWAAFLALNKMQNFDQANNYLKLYERRIPRVVIGAGGIRVPNPYSKAWQRKSVRN